MAAMFDDMLASPSFFADPYPVYAVLREEAPVYWSEVWGAWVLSRYADIVPTLNDPRRYSSAGRVQLLLDTLPEQVQLQTDALSRHYRFGIAHSDPPAHTRLRALLSKSFTPVRLQRWRARIEAVVDQLLDGAAGRDQIDVIADLAYPLPAAIVSEMLGATAADAPKLRDWALGINALFSRGGKATVEDMRRAHDSLLDIRAFVRGLAAARRAVPEDDVISQLVAAESTGDALTEDELISTCVTLFVAGHETTTNMIGNGVLALLNRPDQLARWREDASITESATEELMRFDTPVQRGWRIATEDIAFRGHTFRKGQLVMQMLGSANRDPAVFANAASLDLTRPARENKHLGFGYGIHFCLGAPLARIEVPIAIRALITRFPGMSLEPSQTLRWRHDVALRGVESLIVRTGAQTAPALYSAA